MENGKIIEDICDGKMHRVFSCCKWDATWLTQWMIPNYCPICGTKLEKEIVQNWKH